MTLSHPTAKIPRRTLILTGILVVLIAITTYLYFTQGPDSKLTLFEIKSGQPSLASRLKSFFSPESASIDAETTSNSSPKPLPTGKQLYHFSHGQDVTGPKPTQATIDPIDPSPGDKQSFSITIPQENPLVTSVIATLITDNNQVQVKLKKVLGSKDIWKGTWKVEDSYNSNYRIHLSISDNTSTFEGALRFR